MLVLSRKATETIRIGDDIVVTVVNLEGGAVKIGIAAPSAVSIYRGEVYDRIQEENRRAADSAGDGLARLSELLKKNRETE